MNNISNNTSFLSLPFNELILGNSHVITHHMYSDKQYLDAIKKLQQHSYKDPKIEWGIRWRQILANSIPFILKLLHKGYNDFHVFPISSKNPSWLQYDENEFIRYSQSFGIPLEVYHLGVTYPKYNKKGYVKEWVEMTQLFQNRVQKTTNGYAHDTVIRYLNNLEKVGAITKVCNAYTDLDNHYLYSSRFICSKEKLRELVSLFISTFYTSTSHILLLLSSSSISSYTHTLSSFISYPLLGTMKGGKKEECVKMIQQNNEILPDEEQMRYNGRRIYSEVCSFWNEEKHDDIPAGQMTKQKYCDKIFGQNNWFEFDRRGSIYNITKSLNQNTYLDNSIDIYEQMNKVFASKEERDLYKKTQMNVYFSSVKRTLAFFKRYIGMMADETPVPEDKKSLIEAWWKLCGNKENDWNKFEATFKKMFTERKKSMIKFIGDNKWLIDKNSKYSPAYVENTDNYIFQYESEIYLRFVTELRSRGLRVVQIYDGFYLQKGSISENELNNILKDIIITFVSK